MKFTTNKRKESVADVGNFEIAERRIDFGDADQRRKSMSSYEVLGQTYFLVRDRIEKRRVYETGNRMTMMTVAEGSPLVNRNWFASNID